MSSLLDQLYSTPVPPAKPPPRRADAPEPTEADIQAYLRATTQNYPNFSDPRFARVNPEALQQWLAQGPVSKNVEDRRPPPRRTGRVQIGNRSYESE